MVKVKKVIGYLCGECSEWYRSINEAEECCPRDAPEELEQYECGECGETYEDREEAKECCKEE